MTQDSILKLLKRKKKWMTCKEIASCLKINPGNVTVSLRKLFKQGLVLKKASRSNGGFFRDSYTRPFYWRIK